MTSISPISVNNPQVTFSGNAAGKQATQTTAKAPESKMDRFSPGKVAAAGVSGAVGAALPALALSKLAPASITFGMQGLFIVAAPIMAAGGLGGGIAARASDSLAGSVAYGAASGAATAGIGFMGFIASNNPAHVANLKEFLPFAAGAAAVGAVGGGIAGAVEHLLLDKKK